MIRRTVPQKTISKESSLSGVGLHTGENVELTFKPAPSNTGIVLIREDIDGDNLIEAHIRHISNTDREQILTTVHSGFTLQNMF